MSGWELLYLPYGGKDKPFEVKDNDLSLNESYNLEICDLSIYIGSIHYVYCYFNGESKIYVIYGYLEGGVVKNSVVKLGSDSILVDIDILVDGGNVTLQVVNNIIPELKIRVIQNVFKV